MPESSEPGYRLEIARPAAREIAEDLPEAVAAAIVTGDLLRAPRRVGRPLQRELAGRWAARRGSYRVLYTINDQAGLMTVLAAEHRRDVYRRR